MSFIESHVFEIIMLLCQVGFSLAFRNVRNEVAHLKELMETKLGYIERDVDDLKER